MIDYLTLGYALAVVFVIILVSILFKAARRAMRRNHPDAEFIRDLLGRD